MSDAYCIYNAISNGRVYFCTFNKLFNRGVIMNFLNYVMLNSELDQIFGLNGEKRVALIVGIVLAICGFAVMLFADRKGNK